VKFLNKQIVCFWLLLLFMVGAWLGLLPNTADSFAIADHQRDPVIITATDTDSTENDDDDDEWEA
jgi:hypothetical protein